MARNEFQSSALLSRAPAAQWWKEIATIRNCFASAASPGLAEEKFPWPVRYALVVITPPPCKRKRWLARGTRRRKKGVRKVSRRRRKFVIYKINIRQLFLGPPLAERGWWVARVVGSGGEESLKPRSQKRAMPKRETRRKVWNLLPRHVGYESTRN